MPDKTNAAVKQRMHELLIFSAEENPGRFLDKDGRIDLARVRQAAIRSLGLGVRSFPTNRGVEHRGRT
jgi:hypothetical protein